MFEESIYALIPPVVHATARQDMYKSKFPTNVAPTATTFGLLGTSAPGVKNVGGQMGAIEGAHRMRKTHATFGKEAEAPKPLMRTSTAFGATGEVGKTFQRATVVAPKPVLPSKAEFSEATMRVAAAQSAAKKNFVQANAIENILSAPKREEGPIDWKKKADFGKVPIYLKNIKREITEEHEYIRAMQEAQAAAAPAGMRLMDEDEKLSLIFDLKTKWDAVNKEYQKHSTLSLASLDTIGKVKRKEAFEAQLAQIEKDIEKLSKPVLWVHSPE